MGLDNRYNARQIAIVQPGTQRVPADPVGICRTHWSGRCDLLMLNIDISIQAMLIFRGRSKVLLVYLVMLGVSPEGQAELQIDRIHKIYSVNGAKNLAPIQGRRTVQKDSRSTNHLWTVRNIEDIAIARIDTIDFQIIFF